MVAAPKYGEMVLAMPAGNQVVTRTVDVYFSDVNDAKATFDDGNGASSTSSDKYRAPVRCSIIDIVVTADTTDCDMFYVTRNGAKTGDHLRFANHVVANYRASMNIPFNAGDEIQLIQKT